jgi:hypothetical protein
MDGASNNVTMMKHLATLLEPHGVDFDARDRQVVCYAHCIDLASKAAIGALPDEDDLDDDDGAGLRHPVAVARAVVRAIRGSNLRREAFREVIADGNSKQWFRHPEGNEVITLKPLQLLHYVKTRWDSCHHMLYRLLELRPVCVAVLTSEIITLISPQ